MKARDYLAGIATARPTPRVIPITVMCDCNRLATPYHLAPWVIQSVKSQSPDTVFGTYRCGTCKGIFQVLVRDILKMGRAG